MNKIITGHEEEIAAMDHAAAEWEKDISAQLSHIAATANDELEQYQPGSRDIFGASFAGAERVSEYSLQAIEACIARIRNLQK